MPDLSLENMADIVAGVDEAGRGPWAGPVVAAAVILDRNNIPEGINDSKKLSPQKRQRLFYEIKATAIIGISVQGVEIIDRVNILNATKNGMVDAIKHLDTRPNLILIDGNSKPKGLSSEALCVVKGDAKSLSIAAASIIAKVTRDMMMKELHNHFPYYGWDKNMGYGTPSHQEGLRKFGVSIHHRKSFAPIKELLGEEKILQEGGLL